MVDKPLTLVGIASVELLQLYGKVGLREGGGGVFQNELSVEVVDVGLHDVVISCEALLSFFLRISLLAFG